MLDEVTVVTFFRKKNQMISDLCIDAGAADLMSSTVTDVDDIVIKTSASASILSRGAHTNQGCFKPQGCRNTSIKHITNINQ